MIKRFGFYAVLLSIIAVLLNGCASGLEPSPATGSVPGERRGEEGNVTPGMGPSGPNANVRW